MTTPKNTQHGDTDLRMIPLDELAEWDRNPKDHDVGLLITSLRLYGLVRPPCINEATGKLLYGHGLSKALRSMRDDGEDAPRRVSVVEGTWEIPTHFVDLEEPLHEPYLVLDNRSTELGGWDESILPSILSDIADRGYLDATGFDREDLDDMIQRSGGNEDVEPPPKTEDEADELAETWGVKEGQVWSIPSSTDGVCHRIAVGDSSSSDDIGRLLDGAVISFVLTDPPYGMDVNTDWSSMIGSPKSIGAKNRVRGRKYQKVIGDAEPYDPAPVFAAAPRAREIFLFGADYYADRIPDRLAGSWLVWDKRRETQAEPIGSEFELIWSKVRHKRRVLRHDWLGFLSSENALEARHRVHPTQKPTSLLVDILRQWGTDGDLVLDLYLGSGSTVVAAEKVGRSCYGIELEPKYIAVTLQRLADLGLEPELLDG